MEETTFEIDYDYQQFILYLYLCAAYADYSLNEDEKGIIRLKMQKFNLLGEEDFDKAWQRVLRDFKERNDIQSMELIEACCKKFKIDRQGRQKILNDFREIIRADGKQDQDEEIF